MLKTPMKLNQEIATPRSFGYSSKTGVLYDESPIEVSKDGQSLRFILGGEVVREFQYIDSATEL